MSFHAGERSFLISEALRGAGATLEHRDGERFMAKYDQKSWLLEILLQGRLILK